MTQTRGSLDFSKKKKELNTMEYEACDEPIPDPLADILFRILQRTKCSSNRKSMKISRKKDQRPACGARVVVWIEHYALSLSAGGPHSFLAGAAYIAFVGGVRAQR